MVNIKHQNFKKMGLVCFTTLHDKSFEKKRIIVQRAKGLSAASNYDLVSLRSLSRQHPLIDPKTLSDKSANYFLKILSCGSQSNFRFRLMKTVSLI